MPIKFREGKVVEDDITSRAVTDTKIAYDNIGTFSNIFGSFPSPSTSPRGLAFASDKNRLWHCDSISDYIYEIGTTTGNIIGSFPSPSNLPAKYPTGLAFASDKNRLWNSDYNADYIYEIGTTTGNIIGSFPSPSTSPRGLAFASDKNRLWHCDYSSDYIYEIGTTTGNIIGSFPSPDTSPIGLAFASDKNRLWHCDSISDYIYELGTVARYSHIRDDAVDHRSIVKDAIGSKHIQDNAIGSSAMIADDVIGSEHIAYNSIYTADNVIGSVPTPFGHPAGVALAPNTNRIWHSDSSAGNYIYELGTTTGALIGSIPSSVISPMGLAFSPDKKRLWMTDGDTDYAFEIGTTNGTVYGSLATGIPFGVAVAPDTYNIWYTDTDADYIVEMGSTTGALIGSFPSTVNPRGIAFSPDNKLWQVDFSLGYIYETGTTTGALIGSIPTPGLQAADIDFASDTNKIWITTALKDYFYEMGAVQSYSHLKRHSVIGRHIKDDEIVSKHIANDQIGSEHIGINAISYPSQVNNDVIGSHHIVEDAIGSIHIQDAAVVHAAIASNAVGSLNVIDNSLGYGELTPGLQGSVDCGTVHVAGTVKVVGNIPHDSADSGEPVKIGAKAIDYRPDTTGEQGPSEVSANDRANFAANLRGELIGGVKPQYNALTNIGTTYRSTSAVTSGTVDCWQYRHANLGFELTKGSTPTDIVIEIENSLDGSHFTKQMNDYLGDWRYDDTSIGASGIKEDLIFPISCQKIRVKCTAAGVNGTHRITIANPLLYLRT